MFGFEKLEVWKKAIELTDDVYPLTRSFPDYEKFGLANQMRRAAVSISSNVAEGSSRSSQKDSVRFVEIAYGSLMEFVSELHVAQRQSFIERIAARDLYRKSEEVARMLSGFKTSIEKRMAADNS